MDKEGREELMAFFDSKIKGEKLNPERARMQDFDWDKVDEAMVFEETALSLDYLSMVILCQ